MILSTTWKLEVLFESSLWNNDNTFKVEPSLFYPLVTISIVADLGWSILVVVALLPDKASTTYKQDVQCNYGVAIRPEHDVVSV